MNMGPLHPMWHLDAKPQAAAFQKHAADGAFRQLEELGELAPSTDPEIAALQALLTVRQVAAIPAKQKAGRPRIEIKANHVRAGTMQFEVRQMVPQPFVVPGSAPRWKQVALEVCHKHKLLLEDVIGPDRFRHFAACRHEIFYRLVKELGLGLSVVGRLMGNKDHSTVLHGVRTHEKRLAEQKAVA